MHCSFQTGTEIGYPFSCQRHSQDNERHVQNIISDKWECWQSEYSQLTYFRAPVCFLISYGCFGQEAHAAAFRLPFWTVTDAVQALGLPSPYIYISSSFGPFQLKVLDLGELGGWNWKLGDEGQVMQFFPTMLENSECNFGLRSFPQPAMGPPVLGFRF